MILCIITFDGMSNETCHKTIPKTDTIDKFHFSSTTVNR